MQFDNLAGKNMYSRTSHFRREPSPHIHHSEGIYIGVYNLLFTVYYALFVNYGHKHFIYVDDKATCENIPTNCISARLKATDNTQYNASATVLRVTKIDRCESREQSKHFEILFVDSLRY